MTVTNSVQARIVHARLRQHGKLSNGEIIEGLELKLDGDDSDLREFSVRNLQKIIVIKFDGQVIAEPTLRDELACAVVDIHPWYQSSHGELRALARRMRFEGKPIIFEVRDT